MAEVTIAGLDRLVYKFKELPKRIGTNAAKRALRKGANVIRKQARANAKRIDNKQTADVIAKNIATQAGSPKRNRQAGGILMRVGVMGGARHINGEIGLPGGNTTHWRWVEFGTSKVAARPFMRPAMNSKAAQAFIVTGEAMHKEFDKEIAKLAAE